MSIAHDERTALSNLMAEVGPDAATLCGDWTTRDLAAHLVVRERRLDAAPGILIPALADHTDRVQRDYAARPYEELLALVRTGPPVYSPLRLLDAQINLTEMFVHHEDVRRAAPEWQPRELAAAVQDALWRPTRMLARRAYRRSPVSVELVRADKPDARARPVDRGGRLVELRGDPAELLLFTFGREPVRVDFRGDEADIAAVRALDRAV